MRVPRTFGGAPTISLAALGQHTGPQGDTPRQHQMKTNTTNSSIVLLSTGLTCPSHSFDARCHLSSKPPKSDTIIIPILQIRKPGPERLNDHLPSSKLDNGSALGPEQ